MPDGDRIHIHLAGRYQKIYKQVCEDHFSEAEIAHNLLLPLKEELRLQGSEVIKLINKFADRCDQIILDRAIGNGINWDREGLFIENLCYRTYAKNTAKELAIAACKEQLQDIRHGAVVADFTVGILQKYMWNLCVAKFVSKVPLKREHYKDANSIVVNAKLAGMKQYILEGLSEFAKQAVQRNTFDTLRRPPQRRKKVSSDDLDIDLEAIAI